ncbi:MAG: carbohydrate ABC transporter permease, partial [Granulosicoccus sp.]
MRLRDQLSSTAIHGVLLAWTALAIFPLLLIILNSLKTRKAIFGDPLGLPTGKALSFKGYESVMTNSDFPMFFGNSLIVTCVSLFLILLFGAMAAHAVSEYQFKGNTFIGIYLIVGIMVPIRLGTVALLNLIVDLGLANTLTALILVYTAQGLPIAIFIFTEFLRSVSREIKDSARIDGLSEYRIFFE